MSPLCKRRINIFFQVEKEGNNELQTGTRVTIPMLAGTKIQPIVILGYFKLMPCRYFNVVYFFSHLLAHT